MSTLAIVSPPLKTATPRGARFAAAALTRLLQVLVHRREARAQARERLARESDATRVRRLAQQMRCVDPSFAEDLFAAADRHDRAA